MGFIKDRTRFECRKDCSFTAWNVANCTGTIARLKAVANTFPVKPMEIRAAAPALLENQWQGVFY